VIVERLNLAVRHPDDHEAAATDVTRFRVNDGQREADRHRRIDGIAPLQHDLLPYFARNRTA
jgi:hypothetical protein